MQLLIIVASLLYFIHTMFWWSYATDHCTFVVPGSHMSVVKLLTDYSYCSSRCHRHEQKESEWISLKKLEENVFPLLARIAQLVYWQVKGFNGLSFILCFGTFSLCSNIQKGSQPHTTKFIDDPVPHVNNCSIKLWCF
jgi:hypothetical protein